MDNYTFDVFKKVDQEERHEWHLYVDAVYCADPSKKNMSAEVISKLLGVKNQGGFRYLGKTETPNLVVLFTSGEDVYWRDEIDNNLGLFLYYGDNKTPGTDLHQTNLHGNEILRYVFDLASSNDIDVRKRIPPILVFKKENGRDVKFLGLAVPGVKGKPQKDWLTAVWGCNRNGDRFQNYRAFFTILNTASGSAAEDGFGINLAWLNDIEQGHAYESDFAPIEWKKYIGLKNYLPLIAKVESRIKDKKEQLPQDVLQKKLLKRLHDFFIEKDHGYSFEQFAADFITWVDTSIVGDSVIVTRSFKDGGFDAEGKYQIFKNAATPVYVDFYMQAKCYSDANGIGVKDTSRLISRIKNKQFGIMVTTSYVDKQAYEELVKDGHPVVVINGRNIIEYLFFEKELRTEKDIQLWLQMNYGT